MYLSILATYIVIRLIIVLAPDIGSIKRIIIKLRRIRLFSQKQNRQLKLIDGNYLEVKALYMQECRRVPCVIYIGHLDTEKAYAYIREGHAGKIRKTYQRNYYDWKKEKIGYTLTIVRLDEALMIEFGNEYAEIVYQPGDFARASAVLEAFKQYKSVVAEDIAQINIITMDCGSLALKTLDIKPVDLDLDLYYNEDFKSVDELIRKRLNTENDKGIVLLHGIPGTGKTTYLRSLIASVKKKVLFLSPSVAGNLVNPEFIDLLIDNNNCILVIEDAENIIMDRKFSSNSSVSNLLNISDGLLSDCLNVQIVCTFNSALNLVDEALMRKGRLIACYEFGKLSVSRAQNLSDNLGHTKKINRPMTLAEITNPDEPVYQQPKVNVMGFRRELIEN